MPTADIQLIKSGLIQRLVSQNPHLYQRDLEKLVDAILCEIIMTLARGNRVELRGFGAFSVKYRPARAGRNPRTGVQVYDKGTFHGRIHIEPSDTAPSAEIAARTIRF